MDNPHHRDLRLDWPQVPEPVDHKGGRILLRSHTERSERSVSGHGWSADRSYTTREMSVATFTNADEAAVDDWLEARTGRPDSLIVVTMRSTLPTGFETSMNICSDTTVELTDGRAQFVVKHFFPQYGRAEYVTLDLRAKRSNLTLEWVSVQPYADAHMKRIGQQN